MKMKKLTKKEALNLDKELRDLIKSTRVDLSSFVDEPPYPLVWDKDLNFIGHRVFKMDREANK